MPFDGIVTRAVVKELQDQLIDGRITQIHQPTNTELIFTIRHQRQNFSLLISAHSSYARFHLTDEKFQNPDEPPMFCMHMRKYLRGGFIRKIEQDRMERIVKFTIQARDEIGDVTMKHLVIELMGRHSNILLLDEAKQKIIDCIKHIPPSQNRYRTLLPGYDYIPPPPQDKLNPLTADGKQFLQRIDFNSGRIDRQIVQNIMGISPFFAREIVNRAHLGDVEQYAEQYLQFQKDLIHNHFKPAIYTYNDREDFHVFEMTTLTGDITHFPTTKEMLDAFFSGKAERDRVRQQTRSIERLIKNELKKSKRKLKSHKRTLKRAEEADHYQKLGELLTAHMHLVSRGDRSIQVIDYYDPDQQKITIPLEQELTPSENAQKYFTKYRKLNNSKKVVKREIVRTIHEINYLEQLLQQIERARPEDLADIQEELREEGYLRKQKRPRRRKKEKPKPQRFTSTDGTPIYVGRNNRQNDYLTQRLAHREDIWLHTKDIPGSHVVIRTAEPTEQTLLEAALLAAYFSRAQQSESVPVDYTKVKYVNKPRGGKPGFVTYINEKTLFVTPKKETVKKLVE